MPNWKKLIVSGSDAALNSLNVTSALTASGLIYPTIDGDNGDFLTTDGIGNLSFGRPNVYANVKNISGVQLLKGTPVHATGTAGNASEVIAASASVASTMPATFILNETLADDAEGLAILTGYINGVNTSAFGEGDVVYVGPTGSFTNIKPQGSDNLIQNLGIITKIDATNGSGYVYGSGRSNDVPNLPTGKIWVGDTYTVTSSIVTLDETNFIAEITGSLEVQNSITGSTLQLTNPPTQASEATSLMIGASGNVGTRELGTNAFNSTAFVEDNGGATNEIAFWSSATAISGSGDLTWDGSTLDTNGNLDVAGTVRLGYTGNDPVILGNLTGKRTEWNNPGYFEIYAEDTDSPGTFRETVDIDGDFFGGGFIGVYPSNTDNRPGVQIHSTPDNGENQLQILPFTPTGEIQYPQIYAAYISSSATHTSNINYTGSFIHLSGSYDNKIVIGTCVTDANVGSNNLYVVGDVAGTTKITIGSNHSNTGTLSSIAGGTLNTTSGTCGFIGGGCLNNICSGETFAVIGGGRQNRVDGDYGTVVGGYLNCTDENCSFIGGGNSNHIQDGHSSVIGGGYNNCVSGSLAGLGYQTIAGGCNNKAMEIFATVGGGGANCACGYFSIVGGGEANLVTFDSNDFFSGIFSGCTNTLTGNRSFIGGGSLNIINGPDDGVIAGGSKNCITGNNSFIGGGTLNTGSGACSFIGGGCLNNICSGETFVVIGGGRSNKVDGDYSSIGGGYLNCICNTYSTIGGGTQNYVSDAYSTIAGGYTNDARAYCSFVGGGYNNQVYGGWGAIAGGCGNAIETLGHTSCTGNFIGGGKANCTCNAQYAFIGGGEANKICRWDVNIHNAIVGGHSNCIPTGGCCNFIGGGHLNKICASGYSGILGGGCNTVNHNCSFIIGMGLTSTATGYTFMNNACVAGTTRTTTLVETSAKRFKECILPLQDQIENIKKLEPVEFQWKKDKTKDIGFIAEDVKEIYPDLVAYEQDGEISGVQYSKLTTVLVKALQQQQEQIEELKKEIFIIKQQG